MSGEEVLCQEAFVSFTRDGGFDTEIEREKIPFMLVGVGFERRFPVEKLFVIWIDKAKDRKRFVRASKIPTN